MKNILHGEPVSSGRRTGTARVIFDKDAIKDVRPGDIVVIFRMNPEMALSMMGAGGIITERGSLVSHAASVARELNIPAVIRVTNARDAINDGDVVQLDGSTGEVKILFRKESRHNTLYLTDRCNNNCVMCPLEVKRDFSMGGLPVEEIKRRIDLLPKDTEHMNVSGGEPTLLKDDLFSVLRHLRKKLPGTKVSLLTNGRMFSYRGFAERLRETYPYNLETVVALHSSDEATHDMIAGTKGFGQTVQGLRNLEALGFRSEIRVVVTKLNYGQIPGISEFVTQNFRFARRVCFVFPEFTGKAGRSFSKLYVPYAKVVPYLLEAKGMLEKNYIRFRLYHFPLCVLDESLWSFVWDSITENKKARPAACAKCAVSGDCCGVMQSYVDRKGEGEFKAMVHGKEDGKKQA